MSALLYLIPLSMLLALIGLVAFFWTMNSGQYDDIEGVSQRILLDEDDSNKKNHTTNKDKDSTQSATEVDHIHNP